MLHEDPVQERLQRIEHASHRFNFRGYRGKILISSLFFSALILQAECTFRSTITKRLDSFYGGNDARSVSKNYGLQPESSQHVSSADSITNRISKSTSIPPSTGTIPQHLIESFESKYNVLNILIVT